MDFSETLPTDRAEFRTGPQHDQSIVRNDAAAHAGQEVVVYCDCPNELSAAVLAVELRKRGIARVRPLAGGFEGWRELGNPVARV